MTEASFTVGIEEEYLVVDRETRDLIREAPPGMMEGPRKAPSLPPDSIAGRRSSIRRAASRSSDNTSVRMGSKRRSSRDAFRIVLMRRVKRSVS